MTARSMPEASTQGLALRPPETVMRLERLGSFHATRLSFMRSLLRRIAREHWSLQRERFDLDEQGFGTAVYAVETPKGRVRLIAFSHELDPADRTDRVIAERWDATFTLTTAEPDEATLDRLRANVPLQEAGRCSPLEYVLSRANKSVRMFQSVVEALARGEQPEPESVVGVGYLMRTTAVYGNGKFGLSDLAHTFGAGLFSRPFEAELLTVYLIREFTFDLVAHLARVRDPQRAVALSATSKRLFGIGNATGLGMAPFLVGHPMLINNWMLARETAIARVRALPTATPQSIEDFFAIFDRCLVYLGEWETDDQRQMARILTLRREAPAFLDWLRSNSAAVFEASAPWNRIAEEAERRLSLEGQELVNSLLLEPHGDLIDDLENALAADEHTELLPAMPLSALRQLLEERYGWALGIDYDDPKQCHLFWYVSEEKLEPRLGERFNEPGSDKEMRIGVGRGARTLYDALLPVSKATPGITTAEFLLRHPELRHIVRRVQSLRAQPYAEIQDNLLAHGTVAVDMLRCKLAMFGAGKFDPKSDRWTRITMYQGAPSFADLDHGTSDDWAFPAFLSGATAVREAQ